MALKFVSFYCTLLRILFVGERDIYPEKGKHLGYAYPTWCLKQKMTLEAGNPNLLDSLETISVGLFKYIEVCFFRSTLRRNVLMTHMRPLIDLF